VLFEIKLALERLVDRLDPLAHAAEVAVAVRLVLAIWKQQAQSHRADELFELFAGQPFVGQQDLTVQDQMVIVVGQRGEHRTFADLGVGQVPHDRHPVPVAHETGCEAPVSTGECDAQYP
jgi:hypothetical protein